MPNANAKLTDLSAAERSFLQQAVDQAATSLSVGGLPIGEGEKVLMFLGAANRDPRKWERPDDYDIERRVGGHVGFGYGIHQCVGQVLARLEGDCDTDIARTQGGRDRDHRPNPAPLQQYAARACQFAGNAAGAIAARYVSINSTLAFVAAAESSRSRVARGRPRRIARSR